MSETLVRFEMCVFVLLCCVVLFLCIVLFIFSFFRGLDPSEGALYGLNTSE